MVKDHVRKHVVKRKGHGEVYDEMKVYASVYSAVLNCHHHEKYAEKVALQVMRKINLFVKHKLIIDSKDIRDHIIKELKKMDKHFALMYKHHLDLC